MQREWRVAQGNTIAVWDSSVMLSCTGSMWQIASVFKTKSRTTCPSCVCGLPKSPNDSTFVWPAAAYSSCQEYSSIRTAVVRSPWLVRLSGTQWVTTCAIQFRLRNDLYCVGRGVELYSLTVRSRTQHRQLRSPTEDALVSTLFSELSALEALCNDAHYRSHQLLW